MQMADSDQSVAVKTVMKLLLSAEHYASVCPPLARFYMLEAERLKKKLHLPSSSASQVCPYCCLIRRPDNCTRRLKSRMKTSKHIRKLERKKADGRMISNFQKSLLELHSAGANRLQIRCHGCQKRTFIQGACRPAKLPKVSDLPTRSNSEVTEVQLPKRKKKKKKKKQKKDQTVESNTAATNVLSVGREIKVKKLENHQGSDCDEKRRLTTNRKTKCRQKHSLLQNILKQKTNAVSPDTSTALKSFLMSL